MAKSLWKRMAIGGAPLLVLSVAGLIFWRRYLLELPPPPQPRLYLPTPNGREDFLRAAELTPKRTQQLFITWGHSKNRTAHPFTGIPTSALRALVREGRPALVRLRVGLRREYGMPFPVFNTDDPELAPFRNLARLLAAEADLALRNGDPAQAARSSLDAVRMGNKVPVGGGLIHGLVGQAINAIGVGSLERTLDSLDAAEALRAARELRELDHAAPTFEATLAVEQYTVAIGLMKLIRSNRFQGAALELAEGQATPTQQEAGRALLVYNFTPRRFWIDNYRNCVDGWIARAKAQYTPITRDNQPPLPRGATRFMAEAIGGAEISYRKGQAVRRIAAARLALRAFQLREKRPPATLSELVPKYLPDIPHDPFSSEPLLYRVIGGKPLVYSRGPDGDDDLGRGNVRVKVGANGDITSVSGNTRT